MFFRFLHFWNCWCSIMGGSFKVRFSIFLFGLHFRTLRNRCVINLPKSISENQSALFNNVKLTRYSYFFFIILTELLFAGFTSLRTRRQNIFAVNQMQTGYIHAQTYHPTLSTELSEFWYSCNVFQSKTYFRCNLTIDDYDQVTNDTCINWNIYYNECQVSFNLFFLLF